jgi:hypothetical protein
MPGGEQDMHCIPAPAVGRHAGVVYQNCHEAPAKSRYFTPERDSDARLPIFLLEIQ